MVSLDLFYLDKSNTEIQNKSSTYSTEAGGSRGARRSRKSRLAGDTIVTWGTRKALQRERKTKRRGQPQESK